MPRRRKNLRERHRNRFSDTSERSQLKCKNEAICNENSVVGVLKKKRYKRFVSHLSLIGHIEGTLNVGGEVFKSSYEQRDAKQLLQKGGGQLGLQLIIRV